MFLVIGLGNPGEKYEKTRHNAGFIVVDRILGDIDWELNKNARAKYFKTTVGEEVVEYIKPETFMNESGISARYVKDKHKLSNDNIIVLYDDIDLPIGKIRVSHDRGNGGHNGIRSLEQHLGGTDFMRIRIGISQDAGDGKVIKPNVLGKFTSEELTAIYTVTETVAKALETIIKQGKEATMNKVN